MLRRANDAGAAAFERSSGAGHQHPDGYFHLLILYAQLILGLLTIPLSLMHLDGHNMLNLMGWARNIVTFDPAEAVAAITPIGLLFCCTFSSA